MEDTVVEGKILPWGDAYGIRITKAHLERQNLEPGDNVAIRFKKKNDKVDLSHLPTFSGGTPDASQRHDEHLARGLQSDLDEKRSTDQDA